MSKAWREFQFLLSAQEKKNYLQGVLGTFESAKVQIQYNPRGLIAFRLIPQYNPWMGSLEMGPHDHIFEVEQLEAIIRGNGSNSQMFSVSSDTLKELEHYANIHLNGHLKVSRVDADGEDNIIVILSTDGNYYLPMNLTDKQNGDEGSVMSIFPDPIFPKGF